MNLLSSKNISMSLSKTCITNFNPKVEVSICFIEFENKILFLKNNNKKWGVPGGKFNSKETPFEAVQREVFEETKINLEPTKTYLKHTIYTRVPETDAILYVFKTILFNKHDVIINYKEHNEYLWSKLNDCFKLDLMRGEHEIINLLYNNH